MFKTIKENISAEIVEKKSKFIANVFYVESVEEAEEIIRKVKKEHKEARHNCFAFSVFTKEGITNRFSDDGEPSGTAGSPMLNIITSKNITNVLVVVTRYFGGILLGKGGLVRAYTGAFQEALQKVEIIEKEDVVTKGDIELGTLITKILLISKRQILVESEETEPKDNLEEGTTEDYYVAIDDIDGTNNLRVGNGKLPYCSMIVAFDGSKKTEEGYKYSDYTHAACLDYMTGRIYYTEKGLGRVEEYDLNWHKMSDSTQNIQDNTNLALTLSTDVVSTRRGGSVGYAASTNVETEMLPGELDPV